MRKRVCISFISFIILFSMLCPVLAVGFPSYSELNQKTVPDFDDVKRSSWYYDVIRLSRASGIINGRGNNKVAPMEQTSIAEVIKMAVVAHEIYHDKEITEIDGSPWYQPYVEKALEYGILTKTYTNYNAKITRADAVSLLYRSIPSSSYTALNTIEEIPDVPATHPDYSAILTLYKAGILTGNDKYGTFLPASNIKRCELIAILMRLVLTEQRKTYTLLPKQAFKTIIYGQSGAGRDLTAYQLGSGPNVLMLTFAIHGFEDHYSKDGQELVWMAEQLKEDLLKNYETYLQNEKWTVYILPCLNPDGLAEGTTCNGPGRCTIYSYNASGAKIRTGIDMNRSFPYGFTRRTGSRNYNGPKALSCIEAQAIAKFVKDHLSATGKNVFVDSHGWDRDILSSNSRLVKIFQDQFHYNPNTDIRQLGAHGYLSEYASSLGYDSCLFEFPDTVYSHSDFIKHRGKFINSIYSILTSY